MQDIDEHIIENIKNKIPATVGFQIKKIREEKKLTQTELAILINKDRQYMYKIEKGKVSPTITTLALISYALGVELKIIFGDISWEEVEI